MSETGTRKLALTAQQILKGQNVGGFDLVRVKHFGAVNRTAPHSTHSFEWRLLNCGNALQHGPENYSDAKFVLAPR